MLKIQILSDLHLEAPSAYDIYDINPTAEYLALLGDIGNVRDDGLFTFLSRILKLYRVIFFVPGNHEPYHGDWASTLAKLINFSEEASKDHKNGRLVIMDQTRFDLTNNITILGCILYSAVDPNRTEDVSFGLNDFYYIDNWTVDKHNEAHCSDLQWLNDQVSEIVESQPDRQIVILTHYCPTFDATDPKYEDSKIKSGFTTDLTGQMCWTTTNVSAWAFGHTHYNCDYVDGKTKKRVLTNQRGYYFSQALNFDPGKCLEVNAAS